MPFQKLGVVVLLLDILFLGEAITQAGIGLFGCMAGCKYRPKNVAQLQACGIAAKLNGIDVHNLFDCQGISICDECNSTASRSGELCAWIDLPDEWREQFGAGSCLPQRLAARPDLIVKGITILCEELNKHGVTDLTTAEQNDCLLHSYNQRECEASTDRRGRQCGWCSDVSTEYFEFIPRTSNICIQNHLLPNACTMFKTEQVLCKRPIRPNEQNITETTESPTMTNTISVPAVFTAAIFSNTRAVLLTKVNLLLVLNFFINQ